MPGPFPGMDPYLEGRGVWPDFHNALIVAIRDALSPQVAPAYYIAVEERMYIVETERGDFVGRPDVAIIAADEDEAVGGVATAVATVAQAVTLPLFEEVEERFLEVRDSRTHEVVTVIEVLSPSNKAPGEGRREYLDKRKQVLRTVTSLVEIDLLRAGEPMEMTPLPHCDYRILIREGWRRTRGRLYAFSVRDPVPSVPVPLRDGEPSATLELGNLMGDLYNRARYDLRLDYGEPPAPPLPSADAEWAAALLGRQQSSRS